MEIVTKITGSSLTASEFNQIPDEMENLITHSSLNPSSLDLTQITKAVAQYVADGDFYSTSGTANAIVLSPINPRLAPQLLTDGFKVRFKSNYENTDSATVNVNNLGAKNITLNGLNLVAGKIVANRFYVLIYSSATDSFEMYKSGNDEFDNRLLQCAPFGINIGTVSNGNNNTLTYSGSTITCDPCTITTADSRTRDFDSSTTYDVSGLANGRYQIYKKYSNGDLFLDKDLSVFSTIPANCSGNGVMSINDGVLSNFSDSKFCVLPQKFNVSGGKTFKATYEVTTGNDVATQQYFVGGANISVSADPVILGVYNGKFATWFAYSSSDTPTSIQSNVSASANTTYQVELEFTGTKYNLYVNGTLAGSVNSTSSLWTADMAIGVQCGSQGAPAYPWLGTVNLLNSKIEINGSVWWTGVYKYWLDNSTTPLNLKVLDENNTYQINNDLVYIGDCTVSGGVVTDILNTDFNATREGKWTFNVSTLNTSTSAGVYKVDLSSVIPNDCCNYQLICRYIIERLGIDNSNTNYYIRTNLRGNTFLSYTTIASEGIDGGTTNNDVTQQASQFNVILDGTRNLYVTINGTNLYDNNLYLVGYRRLSAL